MLPDCFYAGQRIKSVAPEVTSESSSTPFTTALVVVAIALGGPTVASASDFSGLGLGALYLFLAIVGLVSLLLSLVTTGILWKRTRRWWIWFLLPLFVVMWMGVVFGGFFVFVDILL